MLKENDSKEKKTNLLPQLTQHYMKNPFTKRIAKQRIIFIISIDNVNSEEEKTIVDEDQGTCRLRYSDILCPDIKAFPEVNTLSPNHFPDSLNIINCTPKVVIEEPEEEDFEIPLSRNELTYFASLFKDKLCMPDYILNQFKIISSLTPITAETIRNMTVKLPEPKDKKLTNKTLVLDLDHTLICAFSNLGEEYGKLLEGLDVKNISYIQPKNEQVIEMTIVIRPYALDLLKQLSSYYEIIIFTAANKAYGDAVINCLDPDGTLIDHRLYREHCIAHKKGFVKDLRIINRDLASTIIVDDTIASFANQLENGIFIIPFKGSSEDTELGALWIFLRQIASANDVRVPIEAKYNLMFFYKLYKMNQAKA